MSRFTNDHGHPIPYEEIEDDSVFYTHHMHWLRGCKTKRERNEESRRYQTEIRRRYDEEKARDSPNHARLSDLLARIEGIDTSLIQDYGEFRTMEWIRSHPWDP